MGSIPLEDNFSDIVGKAHRGLKLTDADLASRASVSTEVIGRIKGGEVDEAALRKIAPVLDLAAEALVQSARKGWYPPALQVSGLAQFNTPYEDMTVNSYLAWDPKSKEAVAFDTGADSGPMLQSVKERGLTVKLILLTHTHPDHIADLPLLKKETGAPAHVSALEPTSGAEAFSAGKTFQVGAIKIETRQTSGHSRGGITFVLSGLERPVAVVGDALFAGSMGGGAVSWSDALTNNRKHIFSLPDDTVICPGHGPLTTVREEKRNNPFYPEFKK
ncbi:MAG TPA: MBL fold metallo-hydrolase [Candidatus Eisenbacteria bacterium]|nr:MBL fold metallo-hydrolase [Candidatus Eisenbacteria bacterium]